MGRTLGTTTGRLLHCLQRNLAWGVAWGVGMGAVFCLLGVALFVMRGPGFLDGYGITFGTLMLVYLVGGAGAGAVVGLARPLLRWRVGAIATGIVGGTIVYGAVTVALVGPIGQWGTIERAVPVILGIFTGSLFGNRAWEEFVEPTLERPKLPPGPPTPRRPLGQWRPR